MIDTKRPSGCESLPEYIKYDNDISVLSSPIIINGRRISNRICYQPMEGCDGTADGAPGELTKRRYKRFAEGGAGLVWFEATAIVPEGRANPRQMYLDEKTADEFAKTVNGVKLLVMGTVDTGGTGCVCPEHVMLKAILLLVK